MTDRPPSPRPDRRPPRGLTLADCGLIVLGTALALALSPPAPIGAAARAAGMGSAWLSRLSSASAWVGRVGLALVPVAVVRASRSGRPLRPAELLLAIVSGPALVAAVDPASGPMISLPLPGRPDQSLGIPGGRFWLAHGLALAAGAIAAVAWLRARRRLPPPAASTLLVLVALSLAWLSGPIVQVAHGWAIWYSLDFAVLRVGAMIERAVCGLIPAAVLMLAIRDLSRRPRSFGALEWLGLSLSLASAAVSIALPVVFTIGTGATASMIRTSALLSAAGPLVALGLGGLLLVAAGRLSWPARRPRNPSGA